MKKLIYSLALALATGVSAAADRPYDPSADAKAQVRAALADAATAHQPVLLIFGANWCADCHALDQALHAGRNAELIAREFKVVKIDVGNFDRNLDVVADYGNPIAKGIPAAVIVSPQNKVLYATKPGELADARRMNDDDVYAFFRKAADAAVGKPAQ
jgi:protein disulfide-isomerase